MFKLSRRTTTTCREGKRNRRTKNRANHFESENRDKTFKCTLKLSLDILIKTHFVCTVLQDTSYACQVLDLLHSRVVKNINSLKMILRCSFPAVSTQQHQLHCLNLFWQRADTCTAAVPTQPGLLLKWTTSDAVGFNNLVISYAHNVVSIFPSGNEHQYFSRCNIEDWNSSIVTTLQCSAHNTKMNS